MRVYFLLGQFFYNRPDWLVQYLLVVLVCFSLFGGGYFTYPKDGYEKNVDVVRVDEIVSKKYRGSDAGFKGFSFKENREVKYNGTSYRQFVVSLSRKSEQDRVIEIFWYHSGFLDMIFDHRSYLGFKYQDKAVGNLEQINIEIRERNLGHLKFAIVFSVIAIGIAGFSIWHFLRSTKHPR